VRREFARAEPYVRECIEFIAKANPDNPNRWLGELHLGLSLLGQKKYGDALPWLLAAYDRYSRIKTPAAPAGKADLVWLIEHVADLRDEQGRPLGGPELAYLRTDPAVRALVLDSKFPAEPFAKPVASSGRLQASGARARPTP
jgi:hypothetical protein